MKTIYDYYEVGITPLRIAIGSQIRVFKLLANTNDCLMI